MSRGFVKAGSLRELVSLQSRGSTRNAYGEDILEWSTYASNVRAGMFPLTMRERNSADQVIAESDNKMIIRYSSSVQPTDRVVWRTNVYNIRSIIDKDARRHHMTLLIDRIDT